MVGFSPLAGIRFVESCPSCGTKNDDDPGFSPLAGIRFVESQDGDGNLKG